MDLVGLIVFLAVGAVAGWLAGQLVKGGSGGLVMNILVGVVGAVIAGFLLPGILPFGGVVGQLISATIGAVLLLVVLRLVAK